MNHELGRRQDPVTSRIIYETPTASTSNFIISTYTSKGHVVAQLAEALRYKPEGRGFDSG